MYVIRPLIAWIDLFKKNSGQLFDKYETNIYLRQRTVNRSHMISINTHGLLLHELYLLET